MPQVDKNALDWVPLSPEALKVIYDEELKSVNAEVEFFSTAVGVEKMMIKSKRYTLLKKTACMLIRQKTL